jgi:ATP phosphoribosyltransferase regulatory subunit HisZ
MDELIQALVTDVLSPLLIAALSACTAWAVTKLPGPLRDLLTASIHQKDLAALTGALQRKALAEVANHLTPPPTPTEMIAYLERVRGDLVKKMAVEPEALKAMAEAAIATANATVAAPVVAVPVATGTAP